MLGCGHDIRSAVEPWKLVVQVEAFVLESGGVIVCTLDERAYCSGAASDTFRVLI